MSGKNEFKLPYLGVDTGISEDLLYGLNGEFSVVIRMENPVSQYAADAEAFENFHSVFMNLVGIIGEGHIVQKIDVVSKVVYDPVPAKEYLQQCYNNHFSGRILNKLQTYVVITRQATISRFYKYDKTALRDFRQMIPKVMDIMLAGGMTPVVLREREINMHILRTMAMGFSDGPIALENYKSGDTGIELGEKTIRCIPLIDIDQIELPQEFPIFGNLTEGGRIRDFPVDMLSFLFRVPDFDCLIYNQVIEIPSQPKVLSGLELKRKRHSGIPDPVNSICVEDISMLLDDVARNNQMLVNAHFNIVVCASSEHTSKCCNFIESALFQLGIVPSKNAYNQMELFRTSLPGNSVELKKYDLFLTTAEAALCLFLAEAPGKDEKSNFLVRFTDRNGVPVAIDPEDLPMTTGRFTNRNKFVLGPSGTGKSFLMNSLLEQYQLYNMDVVIIDTGHSYSGLCSYYRGKYITYSEEKPITMNPFAISEQEYNIEKKDFLSTLVILCVKGQDGTATQLERDVWSNVIGAYYANWFSPVEGVPAIPALCFDSFYEFALYKIPLIMKEESIPFDFDEARFILKKFYAGGEFGTILNKPGDASLLNERFIVFEIDNVKEHKILFPLVTLIIMDLYIQKLRHRNGFRKLLAIEEAWKSISSPLMAGFLVFVYKTARKFWGENITITQDLEDIIGNEIVKNTIISSSDTVILLDQTKFKDSYKEIAALLSINETEKKKIFSVNQLDNRSGRGRFKEVYFRRGAVGEVYGVEVSLEQYLCYTTEKPEKLAVESYVSRFGSYPEALDAFVSDLKSSGLSLGEFVTSVNVSAQKSIS
ncbi:TraG family conjugative transposon ATPase [Pedobacter miscanthi]|uniref:Conjugal transfer protein TraG n=1 Tax=Pedobacter miscanthi TaxID=2259170 RepID=A0A366L504_9SPHI|nr:TraG family conjugative transposon ATPase [Pedobacter miscanthi]RBQ08961.1 conjugal transfer protein TraG [Pedobacter miscanthi]